MRGGFNKELNIAVTGGSGFVGGHLLRRLQREKLSFVTLGRDLVIPDKTDLIINLIGSFYPPFEEQVSSNVLSMQKICEQAVKVNVERIIHISASAVSTETTYGLSK